MRYGFESWAMKKVDVNQTNGRQQGHSTSNDPAYVTHLLRFLWNLIKWKFFCSWSQKTKLFQNRTRIDRVMAFQKLIFGDRSSRTKLSFFGALHFNAP